VTNSSCIPTAPPPARLRWLGPLPTGSSTGGEMVPAPRPVRMVGGAKDPASWRVPGAKATGLTRQSPLKGLGTWCPMGGRIASARVRDKEAPSVGFSTIQPGGFSPGHMPEW